MSLKLNFDRTIARSMDLMDYIDNGTIWKHAYYIQQNPFTSLIPCLTLDLPEWKLFKPQFAVVCNLLLVDI